MRRDQHRFPAWFALALAAAVALVGAACEPDDVKLRLLAYDRDADAYEFQTVTLTTLEDLDTLKGRATELLVGASLTLDYRDGMLRWKRGPRSVAFTWHREGDLVVPEDFDSFAMASIYANLERASLFYRELGLPEDALGDMPTHYKPVFEVIEANGDKEIWRDNAVFVALTRDQNAFFVFPFELFEWIPLPLNTGIMTHEYTHAVFNELVFDANPAFNGEIPLATVNFLSSVNEGFADFMAVALTGDPDFIAHSVPTGTFSVQGNDGPVEIVRDARDFLAYTESMDRAARQYPSDAYDPYAMGSFLCAFLYASTVAIEGRSQGEQPSEAALKLTAAKVLETMGQLSEHPRSSFELADALSLFVGRYINSAERSLVCGALSERAPQLVDMVEGC